MTTENAAPKRTELAVSVLLGSLCLVFIFGCGTPDGSSGDGSTVTEDKDAATNSAGNCTPGQTELMPTGLVDIPHPEIFDAEVRQQLQAKRAALQVVCETPGVSDEKLSESYGEMGMLYNAYGLHTAAEACYHNARTLSPQTFRWPYYLAKIHAIRGESDSVVLYFKQALEIRPDDLPTLVDLAYTYLAADRPEDAKQVFERAVAKDPSCAYAVVGLGDIALLRHEYELAARHFNSALHIQPEATLIHYKLAMIYRNLKKPDKAAQHLAKKGRGLIVFSRPLMVAIEMLRVGMQRRLQAGAAAVRAGQLTEAVAELRKAIETDPDNAMPRISLAATLAKAGKTDEAIAEFREVIRLRPNFARAHFWLGVLLANKGEREQGRDHFLKAIECDPHMLVAHLGFAEFCLKTGNPELAVTHYRSAVDIDPRNVAARRGHAVALTKAGKYREALESLANSRKIIPNAIPLDHAAARLLACCPDKELREGSKALVLAQTVFNSHKSIEHAETVAMAFAEGGNYAAAKNWQKQAIEVAKIQNRVDALPRLMKHLALYEERKPCLSPW